MNAFIFNPSAIGLERVGLKIGYQLIGVFLGIGPGFR
jgi:hypothetical protein